MTDLEFFLDKVKLEEYDPWDMLLYGEEIFHINNDKVRQVKWDSKEGQQILDKFYDR